MNQTRRDANRELVRLLAEWVEKYPDMRFGQILRNMGIVEEIRPHVYNGLGVQEDRIYWIDEFSLEPTELLKRVRGE
jgi:hypothetical protein